MSRSLSLAAAAGILCCLVASTACADRLILIPTGSTLTTGGIRAEYAANTDGDGKAYWVNLGVSRFELEGARFQNFAPDDLDVISAQVSVIPETSFTPAVALGVRDLADETEDQGALYDGQSFYVAASKSIPVTGGIPLLFQDVKLHGGIGTGSLGGLFFGIEGTLPMGLRIMGEYDTEDFNFAASYSIIPTIQARVSSTKGDIYYGAVFATAF